VLHKDPVPHKAMASLRRLSNSILLNNIPKMATDTTTTIMDMRRIIMEIQGIRI
jgi:hypothetical protein